MEGVIHFLKSIHNVQGIIEWGGLLAICGIVFIETGLFAGFFLPGDSLLVTAGIFAAADHLNLTSLLVFVSLCAVMGDQTGYWIGYKTGEFLFSRQDSRFFKKEYLEKTKAFYDRHGPKTIVLARFVPIVRTFAPAVAGAARMKYEKFVFYNIFGGLLWVASTVFLGFFMGSVIPHIEKYLYLVVGAVIVLSFVPIFIEMIKHRLRNCQSMKGA